MKVNKIYFDMDGVLADFNRGVRELCNINPPSQDFTDKIKDDEMWNKIRKTPHFYNRLKLIGGAKELFDIIYKTYGNKCEILTAIPKDNKGITTAREDKINWVRRLLSNDIKINIVYREDKPRFCYDKGCILIDDLKRNIDDWCNLGGTGILNISSKDTIKTLKDLGII